MAKLKVDGVSNFLRGKVADNMLSRFCFENKDDFYKQQPSCALGKLHYIGPSNFGISDHWMTDDGHFLVAIDSGDCTIVQVRLNKNYIEKL